MRGALILVVLLLPVAGAAEPISETPVLASLYAHLDSPYSDFVLNPALPTPYADPAGALTTHSLACVEDTPSQAGPHHTVYGVFGRQVTLDRETGRVEAVRRGLGDDVDLGPNMTLHWSIVTRDATGDQPYVAPNVVVEATVREGSRVSVGDEAYNDGDVIAGGRTSPATLSPLLTGDPYVAHREADGRHVYDVTLPLEVLKGTITAEGFNLRIDVYVENPFCAGKDGYVMPNVVLPYADDVAWPRLDLEVRQPMRISWLDFEDLGDEHVLRVAIRSVWGLPDADRVEVRGNVTGTDGPVPLAPVELEVLATHDDPVPQERALAFVWGDEAGDGPWTIAIEACHPQHGCENGTFVAEAPAAKGAAAWPASLVLVGLAAAAFVRSRRPEP